MNNQPQLITSDQNPKFKLWKTLLVTKSRKKESLFILSGEKIINDFIVDNGFTRFPISALLFSKNHSSDLVSKLMLLLTTKNSQLCFTLDSSLFSELDVLGTDFPLLICQRPDDKTVLNLESPVGLELGLPLTDPANLGALCRTARSFGVSKIVLTANACDPFHPKALRTSSGAILKMDFIYWSGVELGAHDFCLDLQGANIYNFSWPKDIRLWLGEEGQGFKRTLPSQNKISIPITAMESLNATVAGSIAIFSYSQRFNKL